MKRSKDDDRERDRRRPPSPEERVVCVFFFFWLCLFCVLFNFFVVLCYRDHTKHQNMRMIIHQVDVMNLLHDEKNHLPPEDATKMKVL